MNFTSFILITLLIMIMSKIIFRILDNWQSSIRRDIKQTKLTYSTVISRKDLTSLDSKLKIKSRFLYSLIESKRLPLGTIPYRYIYDDSNAIELDEFIQWCNRYLTNQGYRFDTYVFKDLAERKAILSYENQNKKEILYVECVLLKHIDNNPLQEDSWEKIDRPTLQKLVGVMAKGGITHGLIITTGDFTASAADYVKSIPEPYKIQLIDGYEITNVQRKLAQLNLTSLHGTTVIQ